MQMYQLIVGVLGVWRVTHLLTEEAGPLAIFRRMRRLAGEGFWGQLVGCFYCMSVWVAAAFALVLETGWKERAMLWVALSGAAILLERVTVQREFEMKNFYQEDSNEKETSDVLR
jgi:hypothetical protein